MVQTRNERNTQRDGGVIEKNTKIYEIKIVKANLSRLQDIHMMRKIYLDANCVIYVLY